MSGLPERPVFGRTLVTLPEASDNNPHRTGLYVETVTIPRGKINAGKHYRVTDGKGEFWLAPAETAELAAEPRTIGAGHPGEMAVCPDCGPGVAIDEDGCCLTCGTDTTSAPCRWVPIAPDAELAAERPEPAGWGAVMDLVWKRWPADERREHFGFAERSSFLRELRALWPASPPAPAGREALEAAIGCAVEAIVRPVSSDDACTVEAIVSAVLVALARHELTGWARARALEAHFESWVELAELRLEKDGVTARFPAGTVLDLAREALDAPRPDPWPALEELLGWMAERERQASAEADAQNFGGGSAERQAICEREARAFREVRERLRAALGLPAQEADHE